MTPRTPKHSDLLRDEKIGKRADELLYTDDRIRGICVNNPGLAYQ